MTSIFIFTVNAIAPVFVTILVGYLIRKKGGGSRSDGQKLSQLTFRLTLPCFLFLEIAQADLRHAMEWSLLGVFIAATIFTLLTSWYFAKKYLARESITAFIFGSFRSNFAFLGLALAAQLAPNTGIGAWFAALVIPLYNLISVVILELYSDRQNTSIVKSVIIGTYSNPLIRAIFLGAVVSLFKFNLPSFIITSMKYLSAMALPIALISLGMSFDLKKAVGKNMQLGIWASSLKLVITPMIFIPIGAYGFGLTGEKLTILFVALATPTALAAYPMVQAKGGNAPLISNIVMLTTLLSGISLTAWIFALKYLALI